MELIYHILETYQFFLTKGEKIKHPKKEPFLLFLQKLKLKVLGDKQVNFFWKDIKLFEKKYLLNVLDNIW